MQYFPLDPERKQKCCGSGSFSPGSVCDSEYGVTALRSHAGKSAELCSLFRSWQILPNRENGVGCSVLGWNTALFLGVSPGGG